MQLSFFKTIWVKVLLFSILVLAINFSTDAQINVLWEARYTSTGQNADSGKEIALDNNGNVYVTGTSYTSVANGYDIITIKYDALGNELWSAVFNGSGSALDEARDIAVDQNGFVYVTGYTTSTGTNYNYITIKYNSTGTQQWATTYNGTGNAYDEAYAIGLDTLGNSYVTGSSDAGAQGSNFVTIKYDAAGVQQWATSYNGPANSIDAATQLKLDAQFNVYVSGHSTGSGTNLDIATIKYDNFGTQQWVSRFNGTLNFFDVPEALFIDNLNNVYVAGASYGGLATENDYVTIKINSTGTQQWAKINDGPLNDEDKAFDVVVDLNQNVYVTGRSMGTGGTAENMVTIKYDATGNVLWKDTYNGPNSGYDDAQQMRLGNSGALYITGYSAGIGTNNDYLTLKYDTSNGNILWEARFDGPASNSDQAFAMEIDAMESIYVTGTSNDPATFQDFSTIKWCQLNNDAGSDVQICIGDTIQLNANALGAISYNWTPSTGLSDNFIASPLAYPTVTTTYIVSALNALGCEDFDTIVVTVNPLPSGVIAVSGATTFCFGNSVTLTAGNADNYSWTPNGETTQSIVVYTSGNYSVTVIDSNSCVNSALQVVTVYNLPNVSAGSDVNLCNGASMQLNATGAINFTWNTQTNLSDSTIANPIINPTTATTYWVIGEDVNGCKKTDSVSIAISIAPTAIISPPSPNDTLYLLQANGGDIQFFSNLSTNVIGYAWDFGEGGTAIVQNPIYTYTLPGLWNVELITTNGGCKDTANISVMVYNTNAVNDMYSNASVLLYPNPANDYVEIDFNGLGQENILLSIYNSLGKFVASHLYKDTHSVKLNTTNLSNGIYFFVLSVDEQKIVNRLTITR